MNKYEVLGVLLEAYNNAEVSECILLKQLQIKNFTEEDLSFVLQQLNMLDNYTRINCDKSDNNYIFKINFIM